MPDLRKSSARVLAAGTVVVRGRGRDKQVLVVHRRLRDDWSLPKGKLDAGELLPAAAVRETAEETTVRVELRSPLGAIRYLSLGLPKLVRYWLAVPTDPRIAAGDLDFEPGWFANDEVDEICWMRRDRLAELLTYPRDLEIARFGLAANPRTSPLIFLRHAEAEKRSAFAERHDGKPPHDNERPLTAAGLAETPALAAVLAAYGIRRTHSSPARRCLDTVAPEFSPYEEVVVEPSLSEAGFVVDPAAAARRSAELALQAAPTVMVCHRPVLPTMVQAAARALRIKEPSPRLQPGDFLVLHRELKRGGRIDQRGECETEHSADHIL